MTETNRPELTPEWNMVDISEYDWDSFNNACNRSRVNLVRLGDRQQLSTMPIDPNTIYYVTEGMFKVAYGQKLMQVIADTSTKSSPEVTARQTGDPTDTFRSKI